MKASIVYYSKSGNTAKMASYVLEGLHCVDGIEAKSFSLDEVDKDFVKNSKALIVGTPVYGGSMCGKIKMWLETEAGKLSLADKLAGAFSTASLVHGGGDLAVLAILNQLMISGMLIYSSGTAKGQPFIHFGPVAIGSDLDSYRDLFKIYGQRMGQKVNELF